MQQRPIDQDRDAMDGRDPIGLGRTRPMRERWLARDVDVGPLSELFFVSGVVSLLLTRFYLALAGFPQLGGASLHIAHLLWGGLLMLIALVLLLAFVGRSMQRVAALLGGVGFGLFIDEVGKFVTSRNDYFFQPAVAIIYVVFVAIFLSFRTIERVRRFSSHELLANAYDEAVELVIHPTHATHRLRALRLLRASGMTGPLACGLQQALVEQRTQVPPSPLARGSQWECARWTIRRVYAQAVASRWFPPAVVLLIVAYALVFLLLFGLELAVALAATGPTFALDLFALQGHRFVQAGLLASSLVAGGLIVAGLVALPRSRLRAYQWLKRSTLVSIFFGQIFLFYTQQFGALVELALCLIALGGLDALLAIEQRDQPGVDLAEPARPERVQPEDAVAGE